MGNGSQLSVEKSVRAPVGQPRHCFLALEKIKFPEGDLGALTGTAGRPLIKKLGHGSLI